MYVTLTHKVTYMERIQVYLRKLSAVDATSFAIMQRARIRLAYAFDHHFAVAGFRLVA